MPGEVRFRAEVVDGYGLHVGDAATVRVTGSVSPRTLIRAMARARFSRGVPRLGTRFGAWQRLGTAFGSRPLSVGSVPVERTLRTIGAVGGDYANVSEPVASARHPWVSSWRSARGHQEPDRGRGRRDRHGGADLSAGSCFARRYLTFWMGGRDRLVQWPARPSRPRCTSQPQPSSDRRPWRDRPPQAIQDQMHPVSFRLPGPRDERDRALLVRARPVGRRARQREPLGRA